MKIEFVKPVFQIDKFFKVADHLLKADDYELVELGRTMREAYKAQMMEVDFEKEKEFPFQPTPIPGTGE
jgi:hypothetical protein